MFKDTSDGTTHYDSDLCEICRTCHGHFAKTNLQGLCEPCTIRLTREMPNRICTKCHEPLEEVEDPVRGVKTGHIFRCKTCHKNLFINIG